jgi:tRNA uridine 5-carboxymethylaminomethyl modification enzyme
MFTSRAEQRLALGIDSARERLMGIGREMGLVSERSFHVEQKRWRERRRVRGELRAARLKPDRTTRGEVRRIAGIEITSPTNWAQVVRRQDADVEKIVERLPHLSALPAEDRRIVIGVLRYDGYLERQRREADRLRRLGHLKIPAGLDLPAIPGLSREVVEELERCRPRTIAEAERLPGVTAAAVAILVARVSRWSAAVEEPGV